MATTEQRSIVEADASAGDLSQPTGYAYWAGRLSVALEYALGGDPLEVRVARECLDGYRRALVAHGTAT